MQGYMEEVVKITCPSKKKERNQLCEENTKNDLGLKRVELSPFQRVCVQSFQDHLFIPKC